MDAPEEDLWAPFRRKLSPAELAKALTEMSVKLLVYFVLSATLGLAWHRDWGHRHAWWILVLTLPLPVMGVMAGIVWMQLRKRDQPHKALYLARWVSGRDADREHAYESGPIFRAFVWLLAAMNSIITGPIEGVLEILCARFALLRGKAPHVVFYWLALLVTLTYVLESNGATFLPLVLSVLLIGTFVYRSTAHLTIENGRIRMLRFNARPMFPSHIMIYALLMACAFGVVYKHLSLPVMGGFETPLSVDDAIYFSVITLATVGYGDIHPIGRAAKWVCVSEVTLGLMMLVIALNATMTFWLQGAKKEELAAWRKDLSEKAEAKYKAAIALAEQQINDRAPSPNEGAPSVTRQTRPD